ncbi:hypothetical protein J32TS6_15240 [Virgibacillus pantothenticus]|uniref:Uncharacterized protein n=2 Tax=Virgibacillus pantothenticus TaxID=1473 RepID=A0A0L0QJT1_VIRPA|nr:hypothetical protein [Virgibacillus pantothenticus]KNE18811.1 hypothetical protein AFK71_09445 [Virgibacillus pantothenticus]MED3738490.1 hypothetical protein [Virgibacillus pantothenticus]QTY15236.1 hypothetical protein KBP50_15185 [Virgibacillus pantothenticus]SIS83951.1 hypothetical protein SAMN05421787_104265 [Virgibacillus pantothenticus]GIP62969.1 hypothetical protein J32TS6_15240 [Virgibacillus pantothenticus]
MRFKPVVYTSNFVIALIFIAGIRFSLTALLLFRINATQEIVDEKHLGTEISFQMFDGLALLLALYTIFTIEQLGAEISVTIVGLSIFGVSVLRLLKKEEEH